MRMWCGIDWAQHHHDIAVVDDDGVLVVKRRIEDSAAGFRQLLELLAEHAQRSEAPIPIAMETAKGLLPATLQAAVTNCSRSTRWPCPDIAIGMWSAEPKVIWLMRSCWPTSCGPIWPRIARCPPTASSS
jgi:transposase